MVTVRAANGENTKRRHGSTLRFGWKPHHATRKQNHQQGYNHPRKTAQKTTGYYESITMILDHLAFFSKLTARAVAALGGPVRAFSDSLSD